MTKEQNHVSVAAEELKRCGLLSRMIKQLELLASPVARTSTLEKILKINATRRPPQDTESLLKLTDHGMCRYASEELLRK